MDRFDHRCDERLCPAFGQLTNPKGCRCHVSREQMMLARIAELETPPARASLKDSER